MFLHVALGVFSLAFSGLCEVANNADCQTSDAIQHIQKACANENDAMLNAESEPIINHTEVCRHLSLVKKCSVRAVPHCYDVIERQYAMYLHSPYSCHMSAEEILELQKIHYDGIHATQPPASTAPATLGVDWSEQSGTTFLNILPSSTFSSSQEVTAGQPHQEGRHGDNTHDDGTAVTYNLSTMAVLLVATPLLRRLTS